MSLRGSLENKMTDNLYQVFLREIELKMHEKDFKDNHELSEAMEAKAFELNLHPKLAIALVNYFWSGMIFGLNKAFVMIKAGKENVQ